MNHFLKSLEARIRSRVLFGRKFRQCLQFLKQTEQWDVEQLRKYQQVRLQQIVKAAFQTVPYYQRHFDRNQPPAFVDIPYLAKTELREHNPEFVSQKYWPRLLPKGYTSGTTGTPLQLWRSWDSVIWENAFLARQWLWGGYRLGERRAFLRGDLPISAQQTVPPFWKFITPLNLLVMSSYHLSRATMPHYLRQLREFQPRLMQAYPSAIYLLARFMIDEGINDVRIPLIITSSETLLEYQREAIVQAFGCRLLDHYGNAERNVLIGMCEHGSYHVFSDYAFVEFLPAANPDEYELVGTGLTNRAMPLLRYRTGDTVLMDEDCQQPCPCGRSFPTVKQIIGRVEDYIVTPDGRKLGRLDHIYKGLSRIVESQIIQQKDYSVVIKVVKGAGYTEQMERDLLENFCKRAGKELAVRVEYLDAIPRNKQGKFRAVISYVS